MRILLLSDIPPTRDYPAGIVLDQLCRFLPHGSIACAVILNPAVGARISPDLGWIPVQYVKRPTEAILLPERAGLNGTVHLGIYCFNTLGIRRIASEIMRFGRAFGADVLWCTLEGQSLIRLALPVAKRLDVPLFTEVFDPPTWELRAQQASKLSKAMLLNRFASAIRSSRACATGSLPMAQRYAEDYGVKTVAFLPSLDPSLALPPAREVHDSDRLVIGIAGQVYATEEWKALIGALDAVDWRIGRRAVSIRLLGPRAPLLETTRPACIEYLGWHTQENTLRLLSQSDILYCAYWLDPVFEAEARLSFASKVTTYLAAGRPVLFHGPEYASVAAFLKDNDAGLACHSNEPSRIIGALTALATDAELYARLTHNGRLAFEKYLTLSSLRRSFAGFLGVDEDFLLPPSTVPGKVCDRDKG